MRKLILLICLLFMITPVQSQLLYKYSMSLATSPPEIGLSGNGITDLFVQNLQDSTILWAGTGNGLSRLNINTDVWKSFNRKHGFGRGGISAMAIDGEVIWIATVYDTTTSVEGVVQAGGGLAYTLNGGKQWKYVPQPTDNTNIWNTTWDIAIVDSTVWIGSFAGGLQKSTAWKDPRWVSEYYEFDWQLVEPDEYNFDPVEYANHRVFSVEYFDGVLWVGTAQGLNRSLDNGKTWVNFNHQNQEKPISGNWILSIANQKYDDKNIIWAATWETTSESEDTTEFRGVSKSEDGGYTWDTALRGESVYNFAFDDSVVYACALSGLFKSIDGGKTWAKYPNIVDFEADERVYSEEVYSAAITDGTTLWVGSGDGLAKTTDDGYNWKIYRAFSPTGQNGEKRTYAYPNPFSPLRDNQLGGDGYVRIQYNTKNATRVTIRIFDFAMDLVATPVKDKQRPAGGDFSEVWNGKTDDGKRLANGVYFYQLKLDGDGTYWGKIMILD